MGSSHKVVMMPTSFSEKETIVSYLDMVIAKISNQLIFFKSIHELRFSKIVLSLLSIALDVVPLPFKYALI